MDDHNRTAIFAAVTGEMHAELTDNHLLDDSLAAEFYSDDEKEWIPMIGLKTALFGEQLQQIGESCSVSAVRKMTDSRRAFAERPAERPDTAAEDNQ